MFRVLAIDDDPAILRGYKNLYEQNQEGLLDSLLALDDDFEGAEKKEPVQLELKLDITSSGESGFEMVRDAVEEGAPYAVIYLDMRMPGKWDGIATAREIRSVDQYVRIVVVTAYTENLTNVQELIGNSFLYLKKPFMEEELLQMTRFLAEDWQRANELKLALEETLVANSAKNQFLAMMSHELRTPLAVLMGNSELLAESPLNESQQSLLHSMEGAAKNLLYMFSDIIDASHIQSNTVEIDSHPFDLSKLLSELRSSFSERAATSGLEFSIECTVPLAHYYVGDPERLKQTLTNLLGNANKFTEQGFVSLSVTEQSRGLISFTVEDSGTEVSAFLERGIFHCATQ
ncbi:MAG: response regulator [Gammaproteobacteria bacterium]|nr:response regulator [Gammaproteobacteria bacterium]